MPTHRVGRRLWFVSLVIIAAIVAVSIIVNRDSRSHIASPIAVRLIAAAIVTAFAAFAAFAAVAKIAAGPRAAAATAVVGVLIAVVLLHQLA
jgi:hypothetical protein